MAVEDAAALETFLDQVEITLPFSDLAPWIAESWREFRSQSLAIRGQRKGLTLPALISVSAVSAKRFADAFVGGQTSFADDVMLLCSAFGERSARMLTARLGLGGGPPRTLEEIGRTEGISRERARQIITRELKQIQSSSVALATLQLTSAAAQQCGDIVTPYEWHGMLPSSHRPSHYADMARVKGVMSIGLMPELPVSWTVNAWVRPDIGEATIRSLVPKVKAVVGTSLTRWGAVDLAALEPLGPDALGVAYSLSSSLQDSETLQGWLIPTRSYYSILTKRTRKLAHLVDSIGLQRLLRQIARCFRGMPLPPTSICKRLLERDVHVRVDENDVVHFASAVDEPITTVLSPGEVVAVDLLRSMGGLATMQDFQKRFVATGYSAGMGGVLGSRSIVLERYAPGVIGIAGGQFDRERIRDLRSRVRQECASAMLGYKRLGNDVVEIRYKMDRDLLAARIFSIPQNLLPTGTWVLRNSRKLVTVRETYVTGLHQKARDVLEAGAAIIKVQFEIPSQSIEVLGE